MLEFKKYLEATKIDLGSELSRLQRNRGKKSTQAAVFDTIFKKGACGGKSCSRRQPGEVGWSAYDDHDKELMGEKENYSLIKLNPEIYPGAKCYHVEKDSEQYIVLEIPINPKSIVGPAEIKNYNFYIEKNKNQILLKINKDLDHQIKYKKHTRFNNKIIIEYELVYQSGLSN